MAVVNANYVKRNENERQTAKANIYYIQTSEVYPIVKTKISPA